MLLGAREGVISTTIAVLILICTIAVTRASAQSDTGMLCLDEDLKALVPIPGYVYGAQWSDDVVFLAMGNDGCMVFDLENLSSPTLLFHLDGFNIKDVEIVGQIAYIVDLQVGLKAYDIANPSAPTLISTLPITSSLNGYFAVEVSGSHAYVAGNRDSVFVVDVSDPAHMSLGSSFTTTPDIIGLHIDANHLIVDLQSSQAQAFDITDTANPLALPSPLLQPSDVIHNGISFRASERLLVRDVSDPTASFVVSNTTLPALCDRVDLTDDGQTATVAGPFGLLAFDVSNPAQPRLIRSYPSVVVRGSPVAVFVNGTHALTRVGPSSEDMLAVYDLSRLDATAITFENEIGDDITSIAIEDERIFLAAHESGLFIYDGADLSAPTLIGQRTGLGYASEVAVQGNIAVVANNYSTAPSLFVLDVSSPSSITILSSIALTQKPREIALVDGFVYVASDLRGLLIFDITDPVHPVTRGHFNTPGSSLEVQVIGDVAYLYSADRFRILDMSNRDQPSLIGRIDFSAKSFIVRGQYAYFGTGTVGLTTVDLAEPAKPVIISEIDDSRFDFRDLVIENDLLVAADNRGAVMLFDLSDPAAPAILTSYQINDYIAEIVTRDGYVLAATDSADFGPAGMRIARLGTCPTCPADLTGDGAADFFDVQTFLNLFASGDPRADFAPDGLLDFFDLLAFLNAYANGCG